MPSSTKGKDGKKKKHGERHRRRHHKSSDKGKGKEKKSSRSSSSSSSSLLDERIERMWRDEEPLGQDLTLKVYEKMLEQFKGKPNDFEMPKGNAVEREEKTKKMCYVKTSQAVDPYEKLTDGSYRYMVLWRGSENMPETLRVGLESKKVFENQKIPIEFTFQVLDKVRGDVFFCTFCALSKSNTSKSNKDKWLIMNRRMTAGLSLRLIQDEEFIAEAMISTQTMYRKLISLAQEHQVIKQLNDKWVAICPFYFGWPGCTMRARPEDAPTIIFSSASSSKKRKRKRGASSSSSSTDDDDDDDEDEDEDDSAVIARQNLKRKEEMAKYNATADTFHTMSLGTRKDREDSRAAVVGQSSSSSSSSRASSSSSSMEDDEGDDDELELGELEELHGPEAISFERIVTATQPRQLFTEMSADAAVIARKLAGRAKKAGVTEEIAVQTKRKNPLAPHLGDLASLKLPISDWSIISRMLPQGERVTRFNKGMAARVPTFTNPAHVLRRGVISGEDLAEDQNHQFAMMMFGADVQEREMSLLEHQHKMTTSKLLDSIQEEQKQADAVLQRALADRTLYHKTAQVYQRKLRHAATKYSSLFEQLNQAKRDHDALQGTMTRTVERLEDGHKKHMDSMTKEMAGVRKKIADIKAKQAKDEEERAEMLREKKLAEGLAMALQEQLAALREDQKKKKEEEAKAEPPKRQRTAATTTRKKTAKKPLVVPETNPETLAKLAATLQELKSDDDEDDEEEDSSDDEEDDDDDSSSSEDDDEEEDSSDDDDDDDDDDSSSDEDDDDTETTAKPPIPTVLKKRDKGKEIAEPMEDDEDDFFGGFA